MKIKAAVVREPLTDYVIEDVYLQEMRDDEVLVKMVASGICHSDEAFRLAHAPYVWPAVLGHEGAGIVEKVGSNVTNIKVGDHVITSFAYCGECKTCRRGRPATCNEWAARNVTGRRIDGSAVAKTAEGEDISTILGQSTFAEKGIYHKNNITVVDKDIDLRIAGPLGCAFVTGTGTVLNGLKPEPGDSIVVFGTGSVGIGVLLGAKAAGCTTIIAVDIHNHRLETAKELGATHLINSKEENAVERIREITGGGADFVVDTVGRSAVMKDGFDAVAAGGTFAPLAVTTDSLEFVAFTELVVPTKTVKGILMGNAVPQITIQQMLDFYRQGNYPFDKIIKFYDFEDINQAADDSNTGKTLKPVLILDKDYQPA